MSEEYVTKSGRVLTEADIEALVKEAEAGYDVSHLKDASTSAPTESLLDVSASPEDSDAEAIQWAQDHGYHWDEDAQDWVDPDLDLIDTNSEGDDEPESEGE